MGLCNYYLCDICGKATFYDEVLDYAAHGDGLNENPETGHPWPDGDVGWMEVICKE